MTIFLCIWALVVVEESKKIVLTRVCSHSDATGVQGCMGMSVAYKNADGAFGSESESIAVVHKCCFLLCFAQALSPHPFLLCGHVTSPHRYCRAQELGVTHLDTSDVYGPHKNENLVGEHCIPVLCVTWPVRTRCTSVTRQHTS